METALSEFRCCGGISHARVPLPDGLYVIVRLVLRRFAVTRTLAHLRGSAYTAHVLMRPKARRSRRAWVAAVMTAVWVLGPITPVAFCSTAHALVPAAESPMPSCHKPVDQEPAGDGPFHACCTDVTESCCLEAALPLAAVQAAFDVKSPHDSALALAPPVFEAPHGYRCVPVVRPLEPPGKTRVALSVLRL